MSQPLFLRPGRFVPGPGQVFHRQVRDPGLRVDEDDVEAAADGAVALPAA